MTIAIVGNSPILIGKQLGTEIDSHDEVLRFNNFTIENDVNSFGNKTTMLAIANSCIPCKHKSLFLSLKKENRFFMSCGKRNEELYGVFGDSLILDDVTTLDEQIYYYSILNKMKGYKDNHFASSGLLMMQYIVDKYPNAKIDAYGFTFFNEEKEGKKIHAYDNATGEWLDGDKEEEYFNTYLKDKVHLHI